MRFSEWAKSGLEWPLQMLLSMFSGKIVFFLRFDLFCCGSLTVSFRSERVGRRPGLADRIETLYHADKARTEDCILELLVWLHHLVSQSNRSAMQKVTDQCI